MFVIGGEQCFEPGGLVGVAGVIESESIEQCLDEQASDIGVLPGFERLGQVDHRRLVFSPMQSPSPSHRQRRGILRVAIQSRGDPILQRVVAFEGDQFVVRESDQPASGSDEVSDESSVGQFGPSHQSSGLQVDRDDGSPADCLGVI